MCGAGAAGARLEGVDLATQAVIRGTVTRAGEAVSPAYVRLLDAGGEFTAEVPTDGEGGFVFFAGPGRWTVRALVPGGAPVDRDVQIAEVGSVTQVDVAVAR